MPSTPAVDWRKEFGIEGREPPFFFSSSQEVDETGSAAPTPHALQRAFEELELDGVLCLEKTPTIYFREVEQIEPAEVTKLHRLFWNQGVAPILVLIEPNQVYVYSGFTLPRNVESTGYQDDRLVESLNRVGDGLRAFILSVESGEYFHSHRQSFDPLQRVDRHLLRNLEAAREELGEVPAPKLSPFTLDALLCRLVFTCYLFDRRVIGRDYLKSLGIQQTDHMREILGRSPRRAKEELYTLFKQLGQDFNGDLFSDALDDEARQVKVEHIRILDHFFNAVDVKTGQQSFWPYDVSDQLRAFILSVESGEYFHSHRQSFDPLQRVDRYLLRNLEAAREELGKVPAPKLSPFTLNALLCRLVFTCYLFDRRVIGRDYLKSLGIQQTDHMREILGRSPRRAKEELYTLFKQLGQDFNGDLFSDALDDEARQIKVEHIKILDNFFNAVDVKTGQQSFWPYDFSIIPIETISAIYENFLKVASEQAKKEDGAVYTPRFLAELVLDVTLDGRPSLLDTRFLDPACGSGIFLVGLFNRIAEEWRRRNPNASYSQRVEGLLKILRQNIFGVDKNETACRIAAFSLYLAFLDKLLPPDIHELQRKGNALPRLVYAPNEAKLESRGGTIRCADFFTEQEKLPMDVDYVVGNPPWGNSKKTNATATRWCAERNLPFPNGQIATGFIWKAADHIKGDGIICFVLPHGTLFNHHQKAIKFQREWFRRHAVERVMNLADYQMFLFENSAAPALVVRYRKEPPTDSGHRIDYWAPKTDWKVIQADIISVLPHDRWRLTIRQVLDNLKGNDAPCIWKERFWATPRDWRLLDRLLLLPRLRDIVDQLRHRQGRRWLIAEGFQPLGVNDNPEKSKTLKLPSRLFVEAGSPQLRLFLLEKDCNKLPSQEVEVRRSNKSTLMYQAPHVLITKGLKSAFADFDISFRHALRGIHGPSEDRELLLFLAAYLQTALARFFFFHTSSNWGVSRAEVHVEELLRLPLPLPEQSHDPKRCGRIVREVAQVVTEAANEAKDAVIGRDEIVSQAMTTTEKLVEEYFDIDDIERILIADTDNIIIPSSRPTRARWSWPTTRPSNQSNRDAYTRLLCDMLNSWANKKYEVHGRTIGDTAVGVGLVVLEKTNRGQSPAHIDAELGDVSAVIVRLQQAAAKNCGTFELVRGLKVFDKNLLYITKPIGQRFWTKTAALNDADEIAASILTLSAKGGE